MNLIRHVRPYSCIKRLYRTSTSLIASTKSEEANVTQVDGIHAKEFTERRMHLFQRLLQRANGNESPDGKPKPINSNPAPNIIGVFAGGSCVYSSQEVPNLFRQDTNLQYLSGFTEPDSILVLHNVLDGSNDSRSVLFTTNKDAHASLWHGASPSESHIRATSGVDAVLNISEYASYIDCLLCQSPTAKTTIFMKEESVINLGKRIGEMLSAVRNDGYANAGRIRNFSDPTTDLHTLRARKSASEVRIMRHACRIGALNMRSAMRHTRPGINENAIWGILEGEARWRGAAGLAYPPVIAGGNRANTLHYISNDNKLHDGELLLIDAGCSLHGYMSDLTRTYPVSSASVTDSQRLLYEAVRHTQDRLISGYCRPGVTMYQLYCVMNLLLAAHLVQLGFLDTSILSGALYDAKVSFESSPEVCHQLENDRDAIAKNWSAASRRVNGWTVQTFCPHDVGHHLGLDIHDCGLVNRHAPLEAGSVITIEPGLYVRDCDEFRSHKVLAKFAGNGVRIEDDVLITDSGCEVLSWQVPKKLDEISKLVGTADGPQDPNFANQ